MSTMPLVWIGIAVLGAAGGLAHFLFAGWVGAHGRGRLPWGTLAVNLTGAFAFGVMTGLRPDHTVALLVGTAFLGGYTTFSTWMLESERLGSSGHTRTMSPTWP